jgi:hypothetical protein
MIKLYRQKTEVAFRPSLKPEKCHCTAERNRKINRFVTIIDFYMKYTTDKAKANLKFKNRKPAAQRWKHIYGCYKKHLRTSYSFAELCFSCDKWIISRKG